MGTGQYELSKEEEQQIKAILNNHEIDYKNNGVIINISCWTEIDTDGEGLKDIEVVENIYVEVD